MPGSIERALKIIDLMSHLNATRQSFGITINACKGWHAGKRQIDFGDTTERSVVLQLQKKIGIQIEWVNQL